MRMHQIAGDAENVFGSARRKIKRDDQHKLESSHFRADDLKRLRETIITEAEKSRACTRIGTINRSFKSAARPPHHSRVIAKNAATVGRSPPPRTSLLRQSADIGELTRAAAAVSTARIIDLVTTPTPSTVSQSPTPTTKRAPPSAPSGGKRPFLGVRVVSASTEPELDDVFDLSPDAGMQPRNRIFAHTTKKSLKTAIEKSREFTAATLRPLKSATTKRPLAYANATDERVTENALFVPPWKRAKTSALSLLTTTTTRRPRTAQSASPSTTTAKPSSTRAPLMRTTRRLATLRQADTSAATTPPSAASRSAPLREERPKPPSGQRASGGGCPHDVLFVVDSSTSLLASFDVRMQC